MVSATKLRKEVLAELLAGYEKPEDQLGQGGILEQLPKALVERAGGQPLLPILTGVARPHKHKPAVQ